MKANIISLTISQFHFAEGKISLIHVAVICAKNSLRNYPKGVYF